jgi:hypothetical protein
VTIAIRPSVGRDAKSSRCDLGGTETEIFLQRGLDTKPPDGQITTRRREQIPLVSRTRCIALPAMPTGRANARPMTGSASSARAAPQSQDLQQSERHDGRTREGLTPPRAFACLFPGSPLHQMKSVQIELGVKRISPALSDYLADVGENRRRSLSSGTQMHAAVASPRPICAGRSGACDRARIRATRWLRRENHEATIGPSSLETHRLCDAPR